MIVTLVGHELFLGLETGACQKKSLRNTELREQGDQNNANTPHPTPHNRAAISPHCRVQVLFLNLFIYFNLSHKVYIPDFHTPF